MAFELPSLPYAPDALAPYMSAETLDFHHGKHHKAYVDKLNELTASGPFAGKSLEEVVVGSYGKPETQVLFNNAGQHWNHNHFWKWMKPSGGGSIPGEVERRIVSDFGSVEKFKEDFKAAGVGQFGSGWAWLVKGADGKLKIETTANADTPMAHGGTPLLVADVWEHAYYLDFQNRRPDHIQAWLDKLANWSFAEANLG